MIQKIVVSICLLFSLGIFAQQGTSSPYSYYGIGEIKFRGTFDNRAMGGLSIFPDSIHVNVQNPASLGNLKLVNFTMGGSFGSNNLKTETDSERTNRSSIDYIAVGIPTGKRLGAYFGILPYSAVGYNIETIQSATAQHRKSNGEGALNKGVVGFGYRISNNLSFGADVHYNWGEISTKDLVYRDSVQYGTQEINKSDMSGVSFNTGLMWSSKIKNKTDVYASVRYTPQSNLQLVNTRDISTFKYNSIGRETIVDTLGQSKSTRSMKLPSHYSIGAGFGQVRKWQIGAEFIYTDAEDYGNRTSDITNAVFKPSQRYILGGYYIPKYNSYSSYFNTITYRGGLRYDAGGMHINGQPINDMALSLGAGLPFGGRFSNVNIGLEFGQKGTTKAGLVQENYMNFLVSFSLNDHWFVRRKYN